MRWLEKAWSLPGVPLQAEGLVSLALPITLSCMSGNGSCDSLAEDLLNKIGTVLVAKINGCEPQGKLGILGVPAATNGEICCIAPCTSLFLPEYLLYSILYIRHTWADYASQTRKEPRITNDVIKATRIVFPDKAVQQKIIQTLKPVDTNLMVLKQEQSILSTLTKNTSRTG